MYFDESLGTWRGWDGGEWVDAFGKLHNALPDLQGGAQGEYYHFSEEAHGALHALWDGEGMASSWIKRLNFRSVDASATQRTRLFEKDGDFFWSINAAYDEVSGQWNRIDTTKYAYLVELRSENGIACEPIGGIVWWRAVPGGNPIGDYTAVGGWELGFMMTEHRNYVIGGMNLELDGSGSPPYGRLTQIGSNDASGTVVTAMQRNSWYEGSGSWVRDSADRNSAIIGFDDNADLFVWWYPDSTEGNAPWSTSAWQHRLHFHLGGATRGRLDVTRASAETDAPGSAFLAKHKTSGDMADGFAAGYLFAIEDSAAVESIVAAIYGVRDGADNTGKLSWRVASGGSLDEYMNLSPGVLAVNGKVTATTAVWVGSEDMGMYYYGGGNYFMLENDAAHYTYLAWDPSVRDKVYVRVDGTYVGYITTTFWQLTGLLRTAAGGVSAPGHSFSDASAYGMYYDSGSLRWAINGGLKMMLDNSHLKVWGDLEATGSANVAGHYEVDGTRVVTNRQAAISDLNKASPPAGDDLAATKARVNEILQTLRVHGLIAS